MHQKTITIIRKAREAVDRPPEDHQDWGAWCPHDALAGCWCLKQEYAPRNADGSLATFQRTNSAAGPPFRHVTVPLPPPMDAQGLAPAVLPAPSGRIIIIIIFDRSHNMMMLILMPV